MFVIDSEIYIRRSVASRLIGLDYRTLQGRAGALGIRTAKVVGQQAPLFHLADLQEAIKAARRAIPAPVREAAGKATSRARCNKARVPA